MQTIEAGVQNVEGDRAKYLEVVNKKETWEYPLNIPIYDQLSSLGYDRRFYQAYEGSMYNNETR